MTLLDDTARLAQAYLDGLPERHVGARATAAELMAALGGPLAEDGADPAAVIAALARNADPGLVATAGPRYFGFVTGGSLPVAVAADWLAAAWDQNAAMYAMSPAAAVVEEIVGGWVVDLLGLPRGASVGLVTGAQMANVTALAAARHAVLQRAGWDVAADGLAGAPPVDLVVGAEAHVTIGGALKLLGFGSRRVRVVPADDEGRMIASELALTLRACDGPTIVCAQAGNVNSGASDPFDLIAAEVRARENAWLHIDGAFGLWAAASPSLRARVRGHAFADSWATDGHKWLNVPYDSGLVIVAHPAAHAAAMARQAAYLAPGAADERSGMMWAPEASRRARGFALYAALRTLGRGGVAALVDRCCALARRMADRLRAAGVEIMNDVVLNQVLARFTPAAHSDGDSGGDGDAHTRAVIARVQADGTCWLGGTVWRERAAMRISISNWSTSEADVDRSAEAILAAARAG
ncbi:MAG: aspartate aminotransferase family protein [Myxococcales bacterium]|nr:aspartate aminotransferase family protein [Myxococcales bacterium]